jgi:hypothetical protein
MIFNPQHVVVVFWASYILPIRTYSRVSELDAVLDVHCTLSQLSGGQIQSQKKSGFQYKLRPVNFYIELKSFEHLDQHDQRK